MLNGKKRWFPVLALIWIIVSGLGRDIVFESLLLMSSHQADAEVTKPGLQHDTCRYNLEIDGKTYTGTGYDCGNLSVGTVINVWYWPAYPAVASTHRPPDNLLINALAAFGALFVMTLMSIFSKRDD